MVDVADVSKPTCAGFPVRSHGLTALSVIAATTLILDNAPVPEIVYKTF